MLGRLLVCAVVLGMAQVVLGGPAYAGERSQPAATSERASYTPDALPLLMQDERTTWGTPPALNPVAPGFSMTEAITVTSSRPMPLALAAFDALDAPAASFTYLSAPATDYGILTLEAPAVAPAIRLTPRYRREPMSGSVDGINESRAVMPRAHRLRRDPLAMILTFRLDGEPSSPAFSFGGGVASVLNVLPRQ